MRLHNIPRQPMLKHFHSEKVFRHVQSEPSLFQVETIAWNVVRNEIKPLPGPPDTTEKSLGMSSINTTFRYLYTLIIFPLSFLFSKLKSQLSQLFLIGEMLHTFYHPCDPLLDFLPYVRVSLLLGSPELDIALQVLPLQGWLEWKDILPKPAGNTPPNAAN